MAKTRSALFETYLEQNSFHIVETKHVFGLIDSLELELLH
jgi:hypothetical protein